MDILNDKNSIDSVSKPQIESLEKQKEEYKLLGSVLRTKGLKLFGYNKIKDELIEVDIQFNNTVNLVQLNNKLTHVSILRQKVKQIFSSLK